MHSTQTGAVIEYHPEGARMVCIASDRINWSLKDLYHERDIANNLNLVVALSHELTELGVRRAYAPSVAKMSGRFVAPDELVDAIPLPGVALYRNKAVPSDATMLRPDEAFVMSGGGCPVAVVEGRGLCFAAHVGRESAIDRSRLLGSGPTRPHMSVVDELAAKAKEAGTAPEGMTLRVAFQVPVRLFGHPLDDPEHGAAHRAILEYANGLAEDAAYEMDGVMFLDIGKLVAAQGRAAGFSVDENFFPLPAAGPFGHTRHPNPEMRLRRNLVVVQYLP